MLYSAGPQNRSKQGCDLYFFFHTFTASRRPVRLLSVTIHHVTSPFHHFHLCLSLCRAEPGSWAGLLTKSMKAGRTGFRVDEPSSDCSDNLVPPVMLLLAMSGPSDPSRAQTDRIYRIITDVHFVLQNTNMRLLTVKLPPRGVHHLGDSIFTYSYS